MTRAGHTARWAGGLGLWAQGLGWILLYTLAVGGALVVAWSRWDGAIVGWGLLLGLLVLAFCIGVRVHHPWWVIGPPLAFGLTFCGFLLYTEWTAPPATMDSEGWSWVAMFVMMLGMMVVIPCSLAALAGSWWGQRRHSAELGPARLRASRDASPPLG
jgi:hypothetical protein